MTRRLSPLHLRFILTIEYYVRLVYTDHGVTAPGATLAAGTGATARPLYAAAVRAAHVRAL